MIVTVLFTVEEHAALLRHLREQGAGRPFESGRPALDLFDLRGAVLALERATGRAVKAS